MNKSRFLLSAVLLYLLWTLITYLFEGMQETFLKPDAVFMRLIYIVLANLAVGIIGSVLLLNYFNSKDFYKPGQMSKALLFGLIINF